MKDPMRNSLVIGVGVGVVVIAALVASIFYIQRGAHIEVKGRVLKVRTAPLDEHSSAAVVDFRFTNPANYPSLVRSVTVILEDGAGVQSEGFTVSDSDMGRLFDAVPLLGQKYNPTLIARDKIASHESEDRMVAARFEVPDDRLEARKRLVLRIEEIDGAVSEISEK